MNTEELINAWKAEERIAHIHGWDFSHIRDWYTEEEDLPWDYRETILRYLRPERRPRLTAPKILQRCNKEKYLLQVWNYKNGMHN